jgi:hypothetical protein
MSVAVIDSLNLMRASMEEEVVLQSTLAVPAHQALACRIEAYGTPFGWVGWRGGCFAAVNTACWLLDTP